jgi:hypothetical protein
MTPPPLAGLRPATVRRLIRVIDLLSIPSCLPLAACALIAGILCIGAGWWAALPATLTGDEFFNAERVGGLTFRALIGWAQPPDAPPLPLLSSWGIDLVIGAVVVLILGAALRMLRPQLHEQLACHARDIRILALGDGDTFAVAAQPTAYTNVLLGRDGKDQAIRGLRARQDPAHYAAILPRVAPRARALLALGTDSKANLELVRSVLRLRDARSPAPQLDRLWIRIDPRELRSSIGREEFPTFAQAAQEARLISLPEAHCARLLHEQPPNKVRIADGSGRPALVVIGLGETGLELLARLCAQAQSPQYHPLVIVLIDTEAAAITRELLELWPELPLVVEFIAVALESRLPQSAMALFRHLHTENLTPTSVYIALEDPALCQAWEREIGLAIRLSGRESPLVMTVAEPEGDDPSIFAEEDEIENLQRALHEDYGRHACDATATAARASTADWYRLPFDYREDNRSLADHFWTKALDLNVSIVQSQGTHGASIDASMIDILAAAEHRRWIASRTIAGWRFGQAHSESERTHPRLVDWASLDEADREKDRVVIRQMPTVAAAAGLALQPLYTASFPRTRLTEAQVDTLVAEIQRRASESGNALPHVVVPVEDARGFKLAQHLIDISPLSVSLVLAQPLISIALAAAQPMQSARQLARRTRLLLLARPDAVEEVLARWPSLTAGELA